MEETLEARGGEGPPGCPPAPHVILRRPDARGAVSCLRLESDADGLVSLGSSPVRGTPTQCQKRSRLADPKSPRSPVLSSQVTRPDWSGGGVDGAKQPPDTCQPALEGDTRTQTTGRPRESAPGTSPQPGEGDSMARLTTHNIRSKLKILLIYKTRYTLGKIFTEHILVVDVLNIWRIR